MAIFSATLGLSGCSQDINRTSGDSQSAILLRLSQGTREVSVFEDPTFSVLLNEPEALDEENAPAPKVWNMIQYDRERAMSIRVDNCAELDLLELIVYDQLDSQGRPKGYQYSPICGAGSTEKCSAISLLPTEAQHLIDSPDFNHFALAGICISDDGLDAASFIAFLKKA
ncbi:hypothetical protein INS90_00960 [Trueperella pecoris]|uniref:Uncharacterized protein n=1 Tax=Trueperella pecoris TaxID=2733571 RepID=A0A7M1QUZ9_9ACTO|nr:hypothetical protein [Trueperella pecoris]QOR45819.1 hypothetical protein INS88_00855 [Trueperella pecoris]QOR47914.1 hypothetical protein INS90_00960 [Trueperella pecoris]QTG75648.1 hypothetical protein J4179_00785 [Trueperella pecoris]